MRVSGYLIVVGTFVTVALVAYAIIRAVGWEARAFALVVAAIAASHLGVLVWHRQAPRSPERSVKLGLGAVLAVTAVAFTLVFQAMSGWLAYPVVTVPIAAVGGFVFPFAVVGPVWKAFSKAKAPESKDA